MAQTWLTIPLRPSRAARGPALARDEAEGVKQIRLQPLDKARRAIGTPIMVDPPVAQPVEGRGRRGTPAWALTTPPLSLPVELPTNALALRIEGGGIAKRVLPLAQIAEARTVPPPQIRRFPDVAARWTLAVVSERFSEAESFFAHVRSLQAFIAGEKPFSDGDVSFGVTGLFWPSPANGTLFDASDSKIRDRVLEGDSGRVMRFVEAAGIAPKKVLVLVNSRKRAGAGGRGRERPSWTTITADPPEHWEQIALHEVGHAFGLADEYDVAFDLAEPNPLEPNVTAQKDPDRTAWKHLCTTHAPPMPTALRGQEAAFARDTVGTFQGARYRETDRYRPSPFCRMRMTTMPFCAVCREHIRKELLR